MTRYNHQEIEKKWQAFWEKEKLFEADDKPSKPKKYVLDMFPYPSGDGLHVGHVENYTASDILTRYFWMQSFEVLHPTGWDAFGLPAENYAIKQGVHPDIATHKNIERIRKQIKSIGFAYDWSREIDTSSPAYYQWTQWLFLQMHKNGWAYRKRAKANWCPSCQTVLANEQVVDGRCERCKEKVVQKDLEQWFFKITDFAEELIAGLDKLDWPKSSKLVQKNWIGRSEGTLIKFPISNFQFPIEVFTTRPDTLFGCTYLVLAPEHKLVEKLTTPEQKNAVDDYLQKTRQKTNLERGELQREKTGVFIGSYAINPVNNIKIPIWIADYVLPDYGTGAIMAVPAHDQRDWEFAKKYNLPIIEVISGGKIAENAFEGQGNLINSDKFDNLPSGEAKKAITKYLQERGAGGSTVSYRLRDWLISRQRYWGSPIPIIYCKKCGIVPVPEKDLPVLLPNDVDFRPTGESPLVRSKLFHQVNCPRCGAPARRESDTMDTFVCSSWYYLRYCDSHNRDEFVSSNLLRRWLPVDIYIGGAEHLTMHLLYARFFTKALHKKGLLNFDEPFPKLRHQGIILAEDGRKMSKSLGNVVNPDDVVEVYGADGLRLYEMFLGPLEDAKPWNTASIAGVSRFLERVWKFAQHFSGRRTLVRRTQTKVCAPNDIINQTIKKVTDDIEKLRFNTAISALMILLNSLEKDGADREDFEKFILLLSPFAPHLCEEIWQNILGKKSAVIENEWPKAAKIPDDKFTVVIQVNGKKRGQIAANADASQDDIESTAKTNKKIAAQIMNHTIKKIIYVPRKIINFVIDGQS